MDENISQFYNGGVAAVMLLSVLSACGGTAATTPTVTPPPTTVTPVTPTTVTTSLAQMSVTNTALLAQYTPVVYTDLAIVPSSGSMIYTGIVQGDLSNTGDTLTDEVTGEMTLSVTFRPTTANVSGSAKNFRDKEGAAMTGSLTFSGGAFDRDGDTSSDATLRLSANGTLTDTNSQQLVFVTRFEGDFLGSSYDAVGGDMLGGVAHNGTTQNFDGTFIAEK